MREGGANLLGSKQKRDRHRAELGLHRDAGVVPSKPDSSVVVQFLWTRCCNPIESALPSSESVMFHQGIKQKNMVTYKLAGEVRRSKGHRLKLLA